MKINTEIKTPDIVSGASHEENRMPLKIEITVPEDVVSGDAAGTYLANALTAIGYAPTDRSRDSAAIGMAKSPAAAESEEPLMTASEAVAKEAEPPAPKARRGRPPKAKPEPEQPPAQITADEERIGPEDDVEEIDEETAAQDKADEVAEAEAKADPARPLTHDDIRNLLGEYVRVYGMPAAQSDGPVVIGELWPGMSKISDIPDDQDELRRAFDAFEAMMSSNRFGRKAVA